MSFQDKLRDDITSTIVKSLESGTPPWRKPWIGGGFPVNVVSKKAYRGINTLILAIHQQDHQFSTNVYGTFNQWKDAGCMVRKRPDDVKAGEYGAGIVFFTMKKTEKELANGDKVEKSFPLMRAYTVFNADQVEGGKEYVTKRFPAPKITDPAELNEKAERVWNAFAKEEGISLKEGDRACYSLTNDSITMPKRETFLLGTTSYYAALFHESAHATGHEKRLNRLDKFARFGSQAYALEELVAEIAGCFVIAAIGLPILEKLENHASYLASWLKALKDDHKAIFQASTAASAAADRILKPSGVVEEVEEEAIAA